MASSTFITAWEWMQCTLAQVHCKYTTICAWTLPLVRQQALVQHALWTCYSRIVSPGQDWQQVSPGDYNLRWSDRHTGSAWRCTQMERYSSNAPQFKACQMHLCNLSKLFATLALQFWEVLLGFLSRSLGLISDSSTILWVCEAWKVWDQARSEKPCWGFGRCAPGVVRSCQRTVSTRTATRATGSGAAARRVSPSTRL